jgi:hypothetical protein
VPGLPARRPTRRQGAASARSRHLPRPRPNALVHGASPRRTKHKSSRQSDVSRLQQRTLSFETNARSAAIVRVTLCAPQHEAREPGRERGGHEGEREGERRAEGAKKEKKKHTIFLHPSLCKPFVRPKTNKEVAGRETTAHLHAHARHARHHLRHRPSRCPAPTARLVHRTLRLLFAAELKVLATLNRLHARLLALAALHPEHNFLLFAGGGGGGGGGGWKTATVSVGGGGAAAAAGGALRWKSGGVVVARYR